jgi:hypothetical protein
MEDIKTIDKVTLDEQEHDEVDYDFDIPSASTLNLLETLKGLNGLSPTQILFAADALIHEKYIKENADYLQVFHYKGVEFWAISNKLKSEPLDKKEHRVIYLLPEDY